MMENKNTRLSLSLSLCRSFLAHIRIQNHSTHTHPLILMMMVQYRQKKIIPKIIQHHSESAYKHRNKEQIKQKIIKIMENNNHYYQSSSIEQLKIWWTQEVQQQQQQRKIHSFVNHQWGMMILYADDDVGQLSTLLAKKRMPRIFLMKWGEEQERERVKTN